MTQELQNKIIIVGGGFGGIRTALDLEKKNLPASKIILISDKPHFEYHPALYRIVTGKSPLEVCIPLQDIFEGKKVEVVEDSIIEANLEQRELKGISGSRYSFNFLVLALGSETTYFNIPGLKEYSFGFKSINEALRLRRHLHELFETCKISDKDLEEDVCRLHFIIVGGGASGVELAGELAIYTRKLAKKHQLNPSLITIDLIEAASRLLPTLPEEVSEKARKRLQSLAVNIFLNRRVTEGEVKKVYLKDMQMKTETVIWTAGVKPHHLYSKIQGLEQDKQERVIVDKLLQAKNFQNIFIIGDAAATPYAGLAQTAIYDGNFVAEVIRRKILGMSVEKCQYYPLKPSYAIPIGPGWAAVLSGNYRFFGRFGWWLRRLADLRFFLSILPFRKALLAFQSGKTLCEICSICSVDEGKN